MKRSKTDINISLKNELFHNEEEGMLHTSYAEEKAVLECVTRGDVEGLEQTYRSQPETVYGKMTVSNSALKLMFYAGISNTTLVTRYAIEGGLDEETAFSLSDVYIRRMELCTELSELKDLNEQMALDFTLRVKKAREESQPYSLAVSKVMDTVCHGRIKDLSLESLADIAGLSPKYLSSLFHKETGKTLTSYIQEVAIDKARNLLTYSDYSLGEISSYLGFSSQSYFISVFKRHTGLTPRAYREKHGALK